jgi:hypothetical protein
MGNNLGRISSLSREGAVFCFAVFAEPDDIENNENIKSNQRYFLIRKNRAERKLK